MDPDASFAPVPFPLLPPFPDCSRVFTPAEAPEKKNEGEGSFVICAPASSCTYVPTIPRVPVFPPHSRRLPAPAPLPPPIFPAPPAPSSTDSIGPLHPVLTDGKHRFHVEGLIATGGYGRVALATVEGLAAPASQVAIKVYCKDKLIANRLLIETYDLERSIMLENTMNDSQWLVKLRGTFGDLWNRYLIMVRDHPLPSVATSQTHSLLRRIITQTRFQASFSILKFTRCQGKLCVIGSKSSYVTPPHYPTPIKNAQARTHSTLTGPRVVRTLQSINRPLRLQAWKHPRLA
jgi:hypothetical protein